MPRRDGSGPSGAGAMTGRGLGLCTDKNVTRSGAGLRTGLRCCLGLGIGLGLGRGRGRGLGRGLGRWFSTPEYFRETNKDVLQDQKEILKNRMNAIDKQLENL